MRPATESAAGSRGHWVVFAVVGGVAVIFAVVMATYIFFRPDSAPCASGAAADNPVVDGAYQARIETFDNLTDAEAFICHRVPQLHAEGWHLTRIAAERTLPLDAILDGNGFAAVHLTYENADLDRSIQLDATPFEFSDSLPTPSSKEIVKIDGHQGTLIRGGINPAAALIFWTQDKVQMRASSRTDEALPLDMLLGVLGTIG